MMSETGSMQIRSATEADIPFLAWCNYEATSPYPGFCYCDPLVQPLGTQSLPFIEAVFRARALAWGNPEDFMIVESDGKPIGGASGFRMSSDDYRPLRLGRLPVVATILDWNEDQLATFRAEYERVWSDPHDPTIAPSAPWVIECVAIIPEARGKGVAKRLLNAVLDEGARRGYTHAGISVTLGNAPAERVYEGIGFQRYQTYWSDYFEGEFPGTMKYRMRIDQRS